MTCENFNATRLRECEYKIYFNNEIKYNEKSHQTGFVHWHLVLKRHRLKTSPASIIPRGLSYEVIENVFCQQRGLYDGGNINPSYFSCCRTILLWPDSNL